MKKIALLAGVLISLSVSAEAKIHEIACRAEGQAEIQEIGSKIFINIRDLNIDQTGHAEIKSYAFTMVNQRTSENQLPPSFNGGGINGKNLKNSVYNGRKYPNHLKFQITSEESQRAGDLELDYADLIISPDYQVIKTIDQANAWDKNWTWQVEVRKYSAVLAYSINDHHGDYLPLDCTSTEIVNEIRIKK